MDFEALRATNSDKMTGDPRRISTAFRNGFLIRYVTVGLLSQSVAFFGALAVYMVL